MHEHGETIITYEDGIIQSTFIGSFNSAGVQKYVNQIKHLIDGLNGADFAILVDNLQLEGGTPLAYEALEDYNQWLNKQPLVAKAMLSNSVVKMQIIDSLTKAHQKQNVQHFQSREKALCWLKTELDRVN